jgi:hypothetical protein
VERQKSIETDTVNFSIRIGTYNNLPDSVLLFAEEFGLKILTTKTCSNGNNATKVNTKYYACYTEAEKVLILIQSKGYKNAFIVGFINNKRVKIEHAKQKSKLYCK